MRSAEDVADAAGSMVDRGVSQRTMQATEELREELTATRAELDRSLDTIVNLTATIAFLRTHPT
jgi:hypothetical protein